MVKGIEEVFKYNEVSEIKISYNPKIKPSQRPKIAQSQDAAFHLRNIWTDLEYCESFYIVLMNRANKILGISKVSEGGISSTVFDVRKIMQLALMANACGIILAHNHPSGSKEPSNADKQITYKAQEACKVLDLSLLDHIILTPEGFYSFADEGLL